MRNFTIEQMVENTKFPLEYPFHMDMDLIADRSRGYDAINVAPNLETTLMAAYLEPSAFYLTEADKKFYSEQEYNLIQWIIQDQKEKIKKGYELVTLDLTQETQDLLDEYKQRTGLTTEEAIIDILKKSIEMYKEKESDQ